MRVIRIPSVQAVDLVSIPISTSHIIKLAWKVIRHLILPRILRTRPSLQKSQVVRRRSTMAYDGRNASAVYADSCDQTEDLDVSQTNPL